MAGIAWAADETAVVNPWLSAFDVKDAAVGIATGAYQLSLGGAGGMSMSAMGDAVARLLAQLAWFAYLLLATLGLWIFNWALQLKITGELDPVVAVVDSVLGSVIGRIGIVAALIALAWLLAVLYMIRGKTVAALDVVPGLADDGRLRALTGDRSARDHGRAQRGRGLEPGLRSAGRRRDHLRRRRGIDRFPTGDRNTGRRLG